MKTHSIQIIQPDCFDAANHWYPKAINSAIHPMVNYFLNLSQKRIINRYCHLHPMVQPDALRDLLDYRCKYYHWSGADLINVASAHGKRQMVVIENNSCPSGQKSMPLMDDNQEEGGYHLLIERTFKNFLKSSKNKSKGCLAVFYDKNPMEASGYASSMANAFNEPVYFSPFYGNQNNQHIKYENDQFHLLDHDNWLPVRGVFRYLTQKPWNRLPIKSKTKIFNPVIACLAGGRNKAVAAKAYDIFNADLAGTGLAINIPETIWDVSKNEIPLWVKKMGGQAVIKIPYSNAGQGVYTIVNSHELKQFMELDFEYESFIVQSLIGNYNWSSISESGKLYHVGTIPDKKGHTYVFDLRMMVSSTENGIKPLSMYSRKANAPLLDKLEKGTDSWNMLGTNLSIKLAENSWDSDTKRLLLADRRDFNKLGLGLDDLIEAYIQTVLSTIAIDKMSQTLIGQKGLLKKRLFQSLNNDSTLLQEIL